MLKRRILALSVLLTANPLALALAQPDFGIAKSSVVTDGYRTPWAIEVISETEYVFTERQGRLFHYLDGAVVEVSGLPEASYKVDWGWGSLMDVSLHPHYADNRLVYIAYNSLDGNTFASNVARFEIDGNKAKNLDVIVTKKGWWRNQSC